MLVEVSVVHSCLLLFFFRSGEGSGGLTLSRLLAIGIITHAHAGIQGHLAPPRVWVFGLSGFSRRLKHPRGAFAKGVVAIAAACRRESLCRLVSSVLPGSQALLRNVPLFLECILCQSVCPSVPLSLSLSLSFPVSVYLSLFLSLSLLPPPLTPLPNPAPESGVHIA